MLLNTSLISSDNPAALACHINITRSTGSQEVALPIIGISIPTYHCYDAQVGGPLKGPSREIHSRKHVSTSPTPVPHGNCKPTHSVLSQISHLVSLPNKTTENPTTSSYSHHVATERGDFAPFCAAAPSNRASPTPSHLSEHFPYLLVTWDEKTKHKQTAHTIRARTHWDGSCRLTRTAVAPWTCN